MILNFQVEEGAIHVNQVLVRHMTKDSLMLAVDCAQKRSDFSAIFDDEDGKLKIVLSVEKGDDPTLHVTAQPDDNGEYECTWVTVSGLEGDWHVFGEWGKWGPRIALLRKMPGNENWPVYDGQEKTS